MSERPDSDGTRDARLTAGYRAATRDMPPPALDAAILAAARREVGARPRPSGFKLATWRGPLSVAAVVVLSVSLVMLMREEAPDMVAPPRADDPFAAAKPQAAPDTDRNEAFRARGTPSEEQTPKSLGLKPSHSMPQSGLRPPDFTETPKLSSKDKAAVASSNDVGATASSAKRRDAFADTGDARAKNIPPLEPPRAAAKTDAAKEFAQAPAAPAANVEQPLPRPAPAIGASAGKLLERDRLEAESRERGQSRDAPARQMADAAPAEARPAPPPASRSAPAAVHEGKTSSPPAPKPAPTAEPRPALTQPPSVQAMAKPEQRANAPAMGSESLSKLERAADLTPEKWLERIEELRKQGRLDEARTSLAEFRKRHPEYRLPESLRHGIKD